jgi:hypothetical protein
MKEENDYAVKKPLIARISEICMLLTVLIGMLFFAEEDGFHKFLHWLIIPGTFFLITILYSLNRIGAGIVSILAHLGSIGVNGLPALALLLVGILGVCALITKEKLWSEAVKIMSGFATGSFTQSKINSKKQKNDK